MNYLIHTLAGILMAWLIGLGDKKTKFKIVFLWMLAGNLIDIDHLLANPIYDPQRCSINFHPLHSWYSFPVYAAGLFYKRTRYLSIAIALHLGLDWLDCII